jgi:hypothetical protein
MSDSQTKNSINFLALLIGLGITICLSIVGVQSLIGDNELGGIFQLSIAIIFAYFSYREIKYGSIELNEVTEK